MSEETAFTLRVTEVLADETIPKMDRLRLKLGSQVRETLPEWDRLRAALGAFEEFTSGVFAHCDGRQRERYITLNATLHRLVGRVERMTFEMGATYSEMSKTAQDEAA